MESRYITSLIKSLETRLPLILARRKQYLRGTVVLFLFLSACTQEALIVSLKDNDIVGTATMFKENGLLSSDAGSLSLSCSSAVATLHSVDAEGNISSQALASSAIDKSGGYKLSLSSGSFNLKNAKVQYVIKAMGCGSEFCRPVTDFKDQQITGASTLVCMASGVDGNRPLINLKREELKSALSSLSSATAPTLLNLVDTFIADNSLATIYENITGVAAGKLKELPPTSISYTAPLNVHESTSNTYQVSVNHWNSDYNVAYQWKLDGAVVSTNSSYIYTTGQNSQGSHQITLSIGSKDGAGHLDAAKPTRTENFLVFVANDYPAVAPSLSIVSPATSGLPISTRSVTLGLNTGASLSNCASFSKLAITENDTSAPNAADFNITCSAAGSQSVSYNLASAGDGPKALRLWALDAAGHVSTSATLLNINLDTAAPTTVITSTLSPLTNSTSQNIAFTANDNGGSISHFECQIDTGSYTPCSSPKTFSGLSQGPHTASIRAVDTAGNTSPAVSASWTVDLTNPTLNFSATPNAVTNSLSSSFAFLGSDTGGGSIARYECKLDAGSYTTCTSPKIDVLTAGSHTLLVKAIDTAGNTSAVLSYSWTIDTSAPSATISTKPAALTNSQNASFSFVGTDTGGGVVSSYQCSLDASAFAACSTPKTYSSLAAGAHTFAVRAVDSAGNIGAATTYTWTIDLSTPMASINSGPALTTNQTSATFTFSANPPPAGSIIGYQCSLDGAAYASCNSPMTYNSLSQGIHTFGVKSVDNNSALSAAVSETWLVDTTAPILTISSSPAGVNNSTTATLEFTATDSGGAGISDYECKLDSGSYTVCNSPINLSGLSAGAHAYSVRALDNAGNVSSVSTASWTTDLSAPVVTISATPGTITNSSSASFSFSAIDSGGSTVASYQCSLDGAAFSPCSSPKNFSSLAVGVHTFNVKALDATGNISAAETFSWTIDRTNPTVAMTSSPNPYSNSTAAAFYFSGSDAGGGSIASYECSWDAGAYSACTSPKNLTGLSQGSHTFNVRSIDTAGNTSSVEAYTWTVDTIAPALTLTTPAADGDVIPASALTSVTVSGACESGLTVAFSGVSTTNTVCSGGIWSSTLNFSALGDGTLSLTATQTDAAGNSTSRSRTFIKDTQNPTINLTSVPSSAQKGGGVINIGFTVTESNITTAQSFTVSYSSNNGSTWTSAGTVTSTAGPLSSAVFSYAMTLPSIDSSQFKVKVAGVDTAGNNGTSSSSAAFTVDSQGPVLSSTIINDGDASVGFNFVNMKVGVSDNFGGALKVRFSDTTNSGDCQSLYADNNWQAWTSSTTPVSFAIAPLDGTRKICAWAQDAVGNVSVISPSGGTLGTNADTIDYFVGNAPVVTSLSVTNGSGGTQFTTGQTVYINWSLSDVEGLSNTPVDIYVSVAGGAFTQIASGVGALTGNPTSGTGSYTGYVAPAGLFRVKIIAWDTNGNNSIPALSNILNSPNWSIYMGSTERGVGGSGITTTMFKETFGISGNQYAMNPLNGDVYAISVFYGIYKLNAQTGKTSLVFKHGTSNFSEGRNLTGAIIDTSNVAINFDKQGRLYVSNPENASSTASAKIWQVDFANNKMSLYVGGGTLPGTGATLPTPLTASVMYGAFDIDDNGSLYFFSDCDPSAFVSGIPTLKYRLFKLTQNPNGSAGNISLIAGDCTTTLINNSVATETGLGIVSYRHIRQIAVNSDGTRIYVTDQNLSPSTYKVVDDAGNGNYRLYHTTLGAGGLVFDRAHNILYQGNGSISKIVLSATPSGAEAKSTYVTSSFTGDCNKDGTIRTAACINAYGSNGWAPLEIANDGSLMFTDNNFRIRYVDADSKIRTLMGTRPFYGDGLHKSLARGSFKGIYYKNNNSGDYPEGLYFLDATAGVFGRVDPTTEIVSIEVGNQQMLSGGPAENSVLDKNTNVGSGGDSNMSALTFNSDNQPIFTMSNKTIKIGTGKVLNTLVAGVSGKPQWFYTTDNSSFTDYNISNKWLAANLVTSGVNYIFSLGTNNSVSIGTYTSNIGFVDLAINKYRVLMKGLSSSTQVAAADSGTPSVVNGLALSAHSYNGRSFIALNPVDQKLYFSEDNLIRTLTNPTDPSLVTLASPAALNMGRLVYNFAFSPDNKRVYYISNDGHLYCKWIDAAAIPTNCNNTDLGPPTGFSTIGRLANQFTFIQDGKLLISNGTEIYLYEYTP